MEKEVYDLKDELADLDDSAQQIQTAILSLLDGGKR